MIKYCLHYFVNSLQKFQNSTPSFTILLLLKAIKRDDKPKQVRLITSRFTRLLLFFKFGDNIYVHHDFDTIFKSLKLFLSL